MGLARLALILALGAGAVRPPDHVGYAVMYAAGAVLRGLNAGDRRRHGQALATGARAGGDA